MFVPRSDTLSVRWNTIFLDPFTQFRGVAERLLAGVPSGDDNQIYSPNAVLPFQGGIELTDDPVMWIRSRYAKLHPSRVYQEYSSQGWITAPSVSIPADAGSKLLVSPDEIDIDERQRTDISVELLGRTDRVIPAAAVHALDYQAEVEILEPLRWDIPLTGSPAKLAELPEDLREFSFMLRERLINLATESPVYSPPETANNRPPYTLNTQPAMTFEEVNSVIRQMQSNVVPEFNIDEQVTFTITSSSLENIHLDRSGDFVDITFTISDESLQQMLNGSINPQETVGIRVSTQILGIAASVNNGLGPRRLEIHHLRREPPIPSHRRPRSPRFDTSKRIYPIPYHRQRHPGNGLETLRHRLAVIQLPNPRPTRRQQRRLHPNRTPRTKRAEHRNFRRNPRRKPAIQRHHLHLHRRSIRTRQYYRKLPQLDLRPLPTTATNTALRSPQPREPDRQRRRRRNSLAKTMAIKAWLQQQVYSLEIEGPGPRDDGIHYFLFKTINEPCPSEFPSCDTTKRKDTANTSDPPQPSCSEPSAYRHA